MHVGPVYFHNIRLYLQSHNGVASRK